MTTSFQEDTPVTTGAWSNSSAGDNYSESTLQMDIIKYGHLYAGIDLALIPFIVVGNLLVLVSVLTYKRLQTITNMFVASLAVADLMVGLITIPMYAVFDMQIGNVIYNKYLCLLRYAFVIDTCGSSVFNLTFVTAERYFAIFYPLRYRSLVTAHRARLVIALLWTYMTLLSLLPIFGWNTWRAGMTCDFYYALPFPYILISTFLLVASSVLLSITMYIRILVLAQKHRKDIRKNQTRLNDADDKKFKNDTDTVKIMAIVFFLFALFWLPYLLVAPMKYISALEPDLMEVIKNFCLSLAMSNSLVNPIVYCGMRKDFRVAFKRIISTILCRKTRVAFEM